jgi:5-methyltetrahydropteroyltriglutamate--homocysteine methyltransferase
VNRSDSRILTTHVGSLPRPKDLITFLIDREAGRAVGEREHGLCLKRAVEEVVRKQVDAGIDVVTDGEMGKVSFLTYPIERLAGFGPGDEPRPFVWAGTKEMASFPEFYAPPPTDPESDAAPAMLGMESIDCTGPITYTGLPQLQRDIANLKAALKSVDASEAFMPSICPSNVEQFFRNRYYKTDEEYLFAIADAMREEYRAIVDAGLLLQIDDPYLASYYMFHQAVTVAESRKWAHLRVEALNHALRGIPPDRIRHHTCYSIDIGPRVHDMELKDLLDIVLNIHAGAYSFEAANPRHEHEYHLWENVKLPEGKLIIPGVITNSSVLVEHPELVAERIVRFAKLVGRENVIAGVDCGYAAFAQFPGAIHPSCVWAKLKALRDGARLATRQLWPA